MCSCTRLPDRQFESFDGTVIASHYFSCIKDPNSPMPEQIRRRFNQNLAAVRSSLYLCPVVGSRIRSASQRKECSNFDPNRRYLSETA